MRGGVIRFSELYYHNSITEYTFEKNKEFDITFETNGIPGIKIKLYVDTELIYTGESELITTEVNIYSFKAMFKNQILLKGINTVIRVVQETPYSELLFTIHGNDTTQIYDGYWKTEENKIEPVKITIANYIIRCDITLSNNSGWYFTCKYIINSTQNKKCPGLSNNGRDSNVLSLFWSEQKNCWLWEDSSTRIRRTISRTRNEAEKNSAIKF